MRHSKHHKFIVKFIATSKKPAKYLTYAKEQR